jgi:hypothetical protein
VPRDEVVRALLEFSLSLYLNGQLKLIALPKAQRMTLFPDGANANPLHSLSPAENKSWLNSAFPIADKKIGSRKKKGQVTQPQWEIRVTYRIPLLLKEEVRAVAKEHTLPVGEIVCFFILQGAQAFRDGRLLLQAYPKTLYNLRGSSHIHDKLRKINFLFLCLIRR